jgi:hypothetical protein
MSVSSLSWRLPIAIQSALAFLAAALCCLVPPSPRWLINKGRVDQARQIIARLGLDDDEQRQLLLDASSSQLEHSADAPFRQSVVETLSSFRLAFSLPFRARTIFGCFLMAMQQFSGYSANS